MWNLKIQKKWRKISQKKIWVKKTFWSANGLNYFLKPNIFFAYGLGLMHVTGSLPVENWVSRPTGLGGVFVSALLALQQRITNYPNEALTVIKVPNEGYTSHFFAGRPQIGCEISKYKKMKKNFPKKKFGFKKKFEALTTPIFF
jgi:hypothetical protein